jgi:hypothetical protein
MKLKTVYRHTFNDMICVDILRGRVLVAHTLRFSKSEARRWAKHRREQLKPLESLTISDDAIGVYAFLIIYKVMKIWHNNAAVAELIDADLIKKEKIVETSVKKEKTTSVTVLMLKTN